MSKPLDNLSPENQKRMMDVWGEARASSLEIYLQMWGTLDKTIGILELPGVSAVIADECTKLESAISRIRMFYFSSNTYLTDEAFELLETTYAQAAERSEAVTAKFVELLRNRPSAAAPSVDDDQVRTLQEIIEQVKEAADVALTVEQAQAIFGKASAASSLVDDAIHYGVDDTLIRGQIASALSQYLLQRDWPTYGENVDMGQFIAELHVAAVARGLAVIAAES